MAGFATQQLIEWLRQQPRTAGWGAVLAFNCRALNRLLLDDAIERFSTGHSLPVMQGFAGDGERGGYLFSDCVLDAPRLAFDHADVDKPGADATLTLQVAGGTQLTVDTHSGIAITTAIEVFDPLNGPQLRLNVQLYAAPGNAGSAGQVLLDLGSGTDARLVYAEHGREQRLGGELFAQRLAGLAQEQRIVVLAEVTGHADAVINPARLQLRTQAASSAAAGGGGGGVGGGVGGGGGPDGEPLGHDIQSLVAQEPDSDCSAVLLISNRVLLDKVIGAQLLTLTDGKARWQVLSDASGFVRLQMQAGYFRLAPEYYHDPVELMWSPPVVYLWRDSSTLVRVEQNQLLIECVRQLAEANTSLNLASNQRNYAALILDWRLARDSRYDIDPARHAVEAIAGDPQVEFSTRLDPEHAHDPLALRGVEPSAEDREQRCRAFFTDIASRFLQGPPAINEFVSASPRFAGKGRFIPGEVALPGDLAIFGELGPAPSGFSLEPPQSVLGLGQTLQFSARPASQSALHWQVENIAGSDESPGRISASGLYSAPSSLRDTSLRVRVTAQTAGHASSALVSVLANAITVNPVVQVCKVNHSCTLAAAAHAAGALSWSLQPQDNGGQLLLAGNDTCRYLSKVDIRDAPYVLEEVVVLNQDTGQRQSAWVLVITPYKMTLSVERNTSVALPANQARFKVRSAGLQPDELIDWQLLAGAGWISEGTFTQPETLTHRFALLLATYALDPQRVMHGYMLLPLPLTEVLPPTLPVLASRQ